MMFAMSISVWFTSLFLQIDSGCVGSAGQAAVLAEELIEHLPLVISHAVARGGTGQQPVAVSGFLHHSWLPPNQGMHPQWVPVNIVFLRVGV